MGLCLLGKTSFSYISLTKWLDCSSGLSRIFGGVDDPLRKKRGSITYQAIFARLKPLTRLLLNLASGKSWSCPCGTLEILQALKALRSRGISLDSKSSIYEFPALDIACEWPGIRFANSPKKEIDDTVFVLRSGILSIIFVRN